MMDLLKDMPFSEVKMSFASISRVLKHTISIATLFFCAFILGFSLSGCGTQTNREGGSKSADIVGFISDLGIARTPGGDYLGYIFVEGEKDPETQLDKASISVTKKTRIVSRISGRETTLKFGELKIGDKVEVKLTGPIMESYPPQATAKAIVLLKHTGIVRAKNMLEPEVMSISGVTGIGISSRNGDPVIVVYLENNSSDLLSKIPIEYAGYKVITEVTGPIEAFPR